MRSACAALLLLAAPAASRRLPEVAPTGEIVLDLDAPIVAATIAGVPVRLSVALDGRDTVELNPDVAARLPLAFEEAGEIEVGRVTLRGRQARADAVVAGRPASLVIETHGVRCCMDSDGMIGPEQLPFARVRYVRKGAPSGTIARFPATVTSQAGLATFVRIGGEPITMKLSPAAPETVATAAAGAILAQAAGGRWTGAQRPLRVAFGIARPVRPMAFARPVELLGRSVPLVMVRTADFRGRQVLPADPAAPSDIIVRGQRAAQHEWAAVMLGRPALDRCAEIMVERVPTPVLQLDCAPAAS